MGVRARAGGWRGMLGPVGRGRGYWPGVEKIPGDFSGGILAGGWLVTGDRSEYDGATYQLDPRGLSCI